MLHVHELRLVLRRDQRARDDAVPALRRAGDPPGASTSSRDFEKRVRPGARGRPRATCPSSRRARGLGPARSGPAVVDLDRVLAHYAISLIFPDREAATPRRLLVRPGGPRPGGPEPRQQPPGRRPAAGPLAPDLGRGRDALRRDPLRRARLLRGPRAATSRPRSSSDLKQRLLRGLQAGLAGRRHDAGRRASSRASVHRLDDLFVRRAAADHRDRAARPDRGLPADLRAALPRGRRLLNRLGQLRHPIPKPLRAAASSYLDLHLRQAIARLEHDGDLGSIGDLCERGEHLGLPARDGAAGKLLSEALQRTLGRLDPAADLPALVGRAASSSTPPPCWGSRPTSGRCRTSCSTPTPGSPTGGLNDPLRTVFANLAAKLKISQDLLGWRP